MIKLGGDELDSDLTVVTVTLICSDSHTDTVMLLANRSQRKEGCKEDVT